MQVVPIETMHPNLKTNVKNEKVLAVINTQDLNSLMGLYVLNLMHDDELFIYNASDQNNTNEWMLRNNYDAVYLFNVKIQYMSILNKTNNLFNISNICTVDHAFNKIVEMNDQIFIDNGEVKRVITNINYNGKLEHPTNLSSLLLQTLFYIDQSIWFKEKSITTVASNLGFIKTMPELEKKQLIDCLQILESLPEFVNEKAKQVYETLVSKGVDLESIKALLNQPDLT